MEGRVRLEGRPPDPVWLEVPAEHQSDCGTKKLSPKLKVSSEGGVENAVVWVEGNFPPEPWVERPWPPPEVILDQTGCEFVPHILMVPDYETLVIRNSDGFLHNVRAFDESAQMIFNDAMPKKGQVLKKRFKKPGKILVRCGLHHWMHAVVAVQDHPYYALTDESGRFKISRVPDGTYTVSYTHLTLPTKRIV